MSKFYRLQELHKQFIITLPAPIVRAKGWGKSTKIQFTFDSKGNVIVSEYIDPLSE